MELLVDSVKVNMKEDKKLSQALIGKHEKMEKEFCVQSEPNANNAAQKSELDKRSDVQSSDIQKVACEKIKKILAMDRASYQETLNNEKILNDIEMKEIQVEALQYFSKVTKDGNANVNLEDLIRASRSSPLFPN